MGDEQDSGGSQAPRETGSRDEAAAPGFGSFFVPGSDNQPPGSTAEPAQPLGGYGQPADPSGGYGPPGGYGQPADPSGGYGPPGGYGQPADPSGAYGPPGGYGPPGPYGPYGPSGAYGPYGGYGQPAGPPGATLPAAGIGSPGGYGPPVIFGPPGYYRGPGPRRRRRTGLIAYLLVAVLAAGAGAGTVFWLGNSSPARSARSANASPQGGSPGGASSSTVRSVVSAVQPGLVDISSNLGYEGGAAAATGMVISSNGLVLTNNHVIAGTTELSATVVSTNQHFTARWLGFDKSADVAVIKLIGAHNLKTVPIGNSSTVKLGATVVAMGNADGAGGAPAVVGSITGLNRTITASDNGSATSETLTKMLQTNAAIVQGDSGGALADLSGKVIGMNTAAATGSFGDAQQNVAFAIPINRALDIAHRIISGQASKDIQIGSTGFMGVLVPAGKASTSTSPLVQRRLQLQQDQPSLGFPVRPAGNGCLPNDQNAGVPAHVAPARTGALIIGELCGTPAAKGGLTAGDVITAVGTSPVTSPSQLTSVMLHYLPGAAVSVTWQDTSGQVHHSSLVLAQAPPR